MLLLKEIKKVILSVPFLITAAALILMLYSQNVLFFSDKDKINAPQPGQESYGDTLESDETLMMEEAVSSLYCAFLNNSYTTYPIGFYKNVVLNDDKQEKMAEILSELTGTPKDTFLKAAQAVQSERLSDDSQTGIVIGEDANAQTNADGSLTIENSTAAENSQNDMTSQTDNFASQISAVPKENLTSDSFFSLMKQADKLLGGGSYYGKDRLDSFGKVPADYEDALASYELTKTKDKFTGAHIRLFSDYACIVMSVLPVFLSVSLIFKNKRKGLSEVIYTKRRHSFYIIITKYAAVVCAAFIPVLILAYISCFSAATLYPGENLDMLAPLKYGFLWILPSIFISAAVGLFLTVLTGSAAAVFIQVLWWFIDINKGIFISGNYPFYLLVPRHNSLQRPEFFIEHFQSLLINRLFFTAVSVALVAASAVIYEMKRKGKIKINGRLRKTFSKKRNSEKFGN